MSNTFDPIYLFGSNIGVLLLHGYTGTPREFQQISVKIHDLGYSVHAPLYRGHGQPFNTLLKTDIFGWYEDAKQGYERLMLDCDEIYVIGLSMGGAFAVKLAQEYNPKALITLNAPILPLDMYHEMDWFIKENKNNKELIALYRDNRLKYFRFVGDIGQISNLSTITCPIMINQGLQDNTRYLISASMLLEYTSSIYKERHNYPLSDHHLLSQGEEKLLFENIKTFLEIVEK
jgi:carboxylesterase